MLSRLRLSCSVIFGSGICSLSRFGFSGSLSGIMSGWLIGRLGGSLVSRLNSLSIILLSGSVLSIGVCRLGCCGILNHWDWFWCSWPHIHTYLLTAITWCRFNNRGRLTRDFNSWSFGRLTLSSGIRWSRDSVSNRDWTSRVSLIMCRRSGGIWLVSSSRLNRLFHLWSASWSRFWNRSCGGRVYSSVDEGTSFIYSYCSGISGLDVLIILVYPCSSCDKYCLISCCVSMNWRSCIRSCVHTVIEYSLHLRYCHYWCRQDIYHGQCDYVPNHFQIYLKLI